MPNHIIRQNCISCLLGPLFQFGSVIGLPPVVLTCDHSRRILKANINFSKLHLCSSLFLVFLLICCFINCGCNIISDIEDSKNVIEVLARVPNVCVYLGSIIAIISTRLQTSKIHRVCELLQDTLEIFNETNLIVLLTTNDIKRLRSNIYLHILSMIFFGGIISILIAFPCIENLHSNGLEIIGLFSSLYAALVFSLFVYQVHKILCSIFQTCNYHLKCLLQANLQFPQYNLHNHLAIVKLDVSESIACFTRLQSHIFFAYRFFNKFLNPSVLSCLIFFILSLGSMQIQYILRVIKGQPIFLNNTLRLLHLETIFTLVCGIYFLTTVSMLQDLKYDMYSFYSKYPISRLSTEEAIQLEGYMRAIKHQELLFSVSDVFIAKVSTFATVFGAVLALISTALQFILIIMKP